MSPERPIEHSMLGATHAWANPLTARYGTAHGVAIAVMLPHVVQLGCVLHFVKKHSVQFVNAAGRLSAPFYFCAGRGRGEPLMTHGPYAR